MEAEFSLARSSHDVVLPVRYECQDDRIEPKAYSLMYSKELQSMRNGKISLLEIVWISSINTHMSSHPCARDNMNDGVLVHLWPIISSLGEDSAKFIHICN